MPRFRIADGPTLTRIKEELFSSAQKISFKIQRVQPGRRRVRLPPLEVDFGSIDVHIRTVKVLAQGAEYLLVGDIITSNQRLDEALGRQAKYFRCTYMGPNCGFTIEFPAYRPL